MVWKFIFVLRCLFLKRTWPGFLRKKGCLLLLLLLLQALQKDAGAGDTETKKKDDEPEDMALD